MEQIFRGTDVQKFNAEIWSTYILGKFFKIKIPKQGIFKGKKVAYVPVKGMKHPLKIVFDYELSPILVPGVWVKIRSGVDISHNQKVGSHPLATYKITDAKAVLPVDIIDYTNFDDYSADEFSNKAGLSRCNSRYEVKAALWSDRHKTFRINPWFEFRPSTVGDENHLKEVIESRFKGIDDFYTPANRNPNIQPVAPINEQTDRTVFYNTPLGVINCKMFNDFVDMYAAACEESYFKHLEMLEEKSSMGVTQTINLKDYA